MESTQTREPWNKGKLVGQKRPLKPKDIWAIRIHLQNAHRDRDLAMFNFAIDSKLRGCDLVNLRVRDIANGNQILPRAMVVQRKTQRPVQFELTEPTRAAVAAWIEKARLTPDQCLFPSRLSKAPHVSTRQYARILHQWVGAIGLDPAVYGTHTMRRNVGGFLRNYNQLERTCPFKTTMQTSFPRQVKPIPASFGTMTARTRTSTTS